MRRPLAVFLALTAAGCWIDASPLADGGLGGAPSSGHPAAGTGEGLSTTSMVTATGPATTTGGAGGQNVGGADGGGGATGTLAAGGEATGGAGGAGGAGGRGGSGGGGATCAAEGTSCAGSATCVDDISFCACEGGVQRCCRSGDVCGGAACALMAFQCHCDGAFHCNACKDHPDGSMCGPGDVCDFPTPPRTCACTATKWDMMPACTP